MFWFVLLLWILGVRGNTSTTELKNLTTLSTATTVPVITTTKVTSDQAPTTQSTKSTEKHEPIAIVEGFSSVENGISSGNIMIIDNHTFHIPNFHFDGKAPNSYFLVGKGTVTENGTFVPLSGDSPLSAYDGQDIVLTLPKSLVIGDIDWLAVWSKTYHRNLTLVFLKKESSSGPPRTFSLKGEVSSSPVVLVNKKTLFVPSFRYDGDYKDVHFWVWNGSKPEEGLAVLDDKGTSQSLHSYEGQNLNLNLPDGVSTDNTDNFGVWSKGKQQILGSTSIKGIPNVPEAPSRKTKTSLPEVSRKIVKVPKCCPENSILTSNGCENRTVTFSPAFKVYEHNATHFRNESLDLRTIKFEPYYTTLQCSYGKFPLAEDSEEFAILWNGSLLVKGAIKGILSGDNFCLENIEPRNGTFVMQIFVCVPDERQIQTAMYVTYVTFTIISTFCFAITFFVYFFWLRIEDIHRKCFTGYVFAMTMTFLFLTIVQTANVENGGCKTLGFLFQLFMIASFTMLGILCVDIYIIVKFIDDNTKRRKRMFWYLGVSLGVPILSLIISLSRNLTPDVPNSFFKPQYEKNFCSFEAQSQRTILFYVPIGISIAVSIVCLVMTKLKIVENDRDRKNDYFWLEKGTLYKFMFRQCFLTLVIMTISWISNVLMSFLDESSGILNAAIIFEALQGVLIVAVFTANHYGSTYLENRRIRQPANHEMSPLNQNNHANE